MEKKVSRFLIILLCILVIVTAGSTSYLVLAKMHNEKTQTQNNQVNNSQSNATKPGAEKKEAEATTATPTTTLTTADQTADWKTYTGSYEGISLKYPSTWKLTLSTSDSTTRSDERRSSYGLPDWKGPFDGFILTSPNSYIINYTSHLDKTTESCSEGVNCPRAYYYNVFPLTSSNYPNLQLIQVELRDQDNKTIRSRSITLWNPHLSTTTIPKSGDTIEGILSGLYDDKGTDKVMAQLGGSFLNPENYLSMSTDQYFNLPDVKEAVSILKTVTFK